MIKNSKRNRWVLYIAIIVFIVTISTYALNFLSYSFSDDPAEWGQFGDFIGGCVNPLLGLLTIWLLLATLNQNDEALALSREELRLAIEELKRGQAIQAATEHALNEQLKLAQKKADFETSATLLNFFNQAEQNIISLIKDYEKPENLGVLDNMNPELRNNLQELSQKRKELITIFQKQYDQLISRYQANTD